MGSRSCCNPDTQASAGQLQQAVTIIDRRVNGLGVANSTVARQGNDVVISLPGIKNSQAALAQLGQTASANFRPVICQIPPYAARGQPANHRPRLSRRRRRRRPPSCDPARPASTSSRPASRRPDRRPPFPRPRSTPATTIVPQGGSGTPVPLKSPTTAAEANAICAASNSAQVPTTTPEQANPGSYVILPYYQDPTTSPRYVLGPADMSGNGVKSASVVLDQAGQYQVQLNFTGKGSTEFDKIAVGAVPVLPAESEQPARTRAWRRSSSTGLSYSAPTIQASSFNGTAVISGSTAAPFTSSQANDLAVALKYGSLPGALHPAVRADGVGHDRQGLAQGRAARRHRRDHPRAALHDLLLPRCSAWSWWWAWPSAGRCCTRSSPCSARPRALTLTLAGVTGIIVSIGITVDSYVVYFERLKDEVRAGRTHPPVGRPQLRPGLPHRAHRRHRRLPGRRHPVPVHDRRRAGLRLHAGPLHPPRRLHRLLLHPARRDPGRPAPRLHRRPLHRHRAGPGRRGHG